MDHTNAGERATVGEIARLTGVSVRTLHHYDEIGLVRPAGRSDAGYRWYGPAEVARLQEVLFYKELGFGLDEIKRIVTDAAHDRGSALRRQRLMLERKAEHLLALIAAVDAAVEADRKGIAMTNDEMLGVFGGFDPAEHEDEAGQRWGATDAYRQSAKRTARYTKADWEQMGRESAEIEQALAALLDEGAPADGAEAMGLAERHRAHITKWFYECTPKIHVGLGEMYVADPRFRERYEQVHEGLAAYLAAAIAANAAR